MTDASSKACPVLFATEEDCCGCTGCWAVCPVQAIFMIEDERGFLYPVIDKEKCIRCFKCKQVCAYQEHLSLI